jgi:hypothetical protein
VSDEFKYGWTTNPGPGARGIDTRDIHRGPLLAEIERLTSDLSRERSAREEAETDRDRWNETALTIQANLAAAHEQEKRDEWRRGHDEGFAGVDPFIARAEAAEAAREEAERRLAVGERVIAGTAYPSDATLTREQAFHGWEVANRQRDGYAERARAAERALSASREEAGRVLAAIRLALGTMQKPMERMEKVCALGMVEPACDHDALRSLRAAMRTLQDAHDAAARAALSVDDGASRSGEGTR